MEQQHAVLIGASRGVGNYAALELLSSGKWTCTLLLRKPEAIESDPKMAEYLKQGRINIVKGDATNTEDVAKLFQKDVDVVITSVGATPSFGWKGLSIDQPTICTDSMFTLVNVLKTLSKVPRVIAVSSMGMADNHKYLPLPLRVTFPVVLEKPHKDKDGLEYILQKASKALPSPEAYAPPEYVISRSKLDSTPADFIPEIIIVRAAVLTGDESKGKYKVGETIRSWNIHREDVGNFIATQCMPGQSTWVNKLPVVGY